MYTFYTLSIVGVTLWLWSMYVYIPQNYPTRLRSLGTGWTDGRGPPGCLGRRPDRRRAVHRGQPGALLIFVTIPCAVLPGVLIAIFGKNQRRRTLEELSR